MDVFSGIMTSDLVVTGAAGGAFFEIDAAENRIGAVAIADLEDGLLNLALFSEKLSFGGFVASESGVVGKKIGLSERSGSLENYILIDEIVGSESKFANSEFGMGIFIKNFEETFCN